jgi:hypothetical protein
LTIEDMLGVVADAGVIGLLTLAVIGGFRGWYFWRWYVDELRGRITDLERKLDKALNTAERGTEQASRATEMAERERGQRAG